MRDLRGPLPWLARIRWLWAAHLRFPLAADVLLWEDRAFVRGVGYFHLHREADGTWRAERMSF